MGGQERHQVGADLQRRRAAGLPLTARLVASKDLAALSASTIWSVSRVLSAPRHRVDVDPGVLDLLGQRLAEPTTAAFEAA